MHIIKKSQLEGIYKTELASDSETGKRLTFLLTIDEDGYCDQYEVVQKGSIRYLGQSIAAAIREYNEIN